MQELTTRTGFDLAEREHVRRALLRYMREHRIGVPKLKDRIIEADPRRREIPLSTLQRFLIGRHHTQEHHVALCQAFVRELPWYGEGRDLAEFGTALSVFLQGYVEVSEREVLAARLAEEFAASYQSASSTLTLSVLERQPYLLAHETARALLAPDQDSERKGDELEARRRSRDGVMVLAASGVYVVLRDGLTRQLKMIHLMKRATPADGEETFVLEGESYQPAFMDGMRPIQERVRFVAAQARERA